METHFLIFVLVALVVLLGTISFLFTKKAKKHTDQSEEKCSYSDTELGQPDMIFQSKDKAVTIALKTDKTNDADDISAFAEIYIKGKPISFAGQPLLFPVGRLTENIPSKSNILKKIYYTARSTDFLRPSFDLKHFKERILFRIYGMHSKNIRNKIINAIQSFDPTLCQKLKRQEDMERKMTEVLLAQAHQAELHIQKQKAKRRQQDNPSLSDIEKAISNEQLVNVLPENEIKSRSVQISKDDARV